MFLKPFFILFFLPFVFSPFLSFLCRRRCRGASYAVDLYSPACMHEYFAFSRRQPYYSSRRLIKFNSFFVRSLTRSFPRSSLHCVCVCVCAFFLAFVVFAQGSRRAHLFIRFHCEMVARCHPRCLNSVTLTSLQMLTVALEGEGGGLRRCGT